MEEDERPTGANGFRCFGSAAAGQAARSLRTMPWRAASS